MANRCPQSRYVGPGILRGYRWLIFSAGYASVMRSSTDHVAGSIYQVSEADEKSLDDYEGVADGLYTKEECEIEGPDGPISCLVYVGRDDIPGRIRAEYVSRMQSAIQDADLSEEYLEQYIWPFVPKPTGN